MQDTPPSRLILDKVLGITDLRSDKRIDFVGCRVDEERQELQTLVSDISHQVKTPVSNLKMATDTLLEKPMTEAERTDFIRGIRSQTDKLDFLFQALVKTSRLETGVIQLDIKVGRCDK